MDFILTVLSHSASQPGDLVRAGSELWQPGKNGVQELSLSVRGQVVWSPLELLHILAKMFDSGGPWSQYPFPLCIEIDPQPGPQAYTAQQVGAQDIAGPVGTQVNARRANQYHQQS